MQEQRALLGWPAASTFHKYKAGDHGALTFDTLTRLSLVSASTRASRSSIRADVRRHLAAHAEQQSDFGGRPGAHTDDRRRHRRPLPGPASARQPAGRMELSPVASLVRWTAAPRLIPSRYPVVGLLDRVASPADLDAVFELEGWTNDRISNELGSSTPSRRASGSPARRWPAWSWPPTATRGPAGVGSRPRARGLVRGADLATALAESVYHRTAELREVGGFETAVQMRVYLADFRARFHDVRPAHRRGRRLPIRTTTASHRHSRASCSTTDPTGSCTAPSVRPASAWPASVRRWCAMSAPADTTSSLARPSRSGDSQALTV